MLGAIVGDIVGSRFEFANTHRTDFELFADGCDYTDDTICTVAVADALLRGANFADTLQTWCRRSPHPKGGTADAFISGFTRPHQCRIAALAMAVPCASLRVVGYLLAMPSCRKLRRVPSAPTTTPRG